MPVCPLRKAGADHWVENGAEGVTYAADNHIKKYCHYLSSILGLFRGVLNGFLVANVNYRYI